MSSQKLVEALQSSEGSTFTHSHDFDIQGLPDAIKTIKAHCTIFHVDNCFQLQTVTPGIGDLSLLRWLNLSYNKIRVLPPSVGKLRNLERLHVNNNVIEELPLEIWGLKQLEELRVDNNKLRALPSELLFLPRLREVHAENNLLVSRASVEGAEMGTVFPAPPAGDCSNCCGRFGRGAISFVTFHKIGSCADDLPFVHYVCDDHCEQQLRGRLLERGQ